MSEWGSAMTVDRKEPPKIRTRALDPLAAHTNTNTHRNTHRNTKTKFNDKIRRQKNEKIQMQNTKRKHEYKIRIKNQKTKETLPEAQQKPEIDYIA